MTEMQHDERFARRVQATKDRKSSCAYPDDERYAVSSRAMQEDDIENNQSSGPEINHIPMKYSWNVKQHKYQRKE